MPTPISPFQEAHELLEYLTRNESLAGNYADMLRNLIEIQESRILLDTATGCQFWELYRLGSFLIDVLTAPPCLRPFPEAPEDILQHIADPAERATTATWFRLLWKADTGTAMTREITIAGTVTRRFAVADVAHGKLLGTVKPVEE